MQNSWRLWPILVFVSGIFLPVMAEKDKVDSTQVNFDAVPNPFSPLDPWACQLSYRAFSDVSLWVSVKVQVFDQGGNLVFESDEVQINKNILVIPGKYQANPNSPDRLRSLAPYVWDGRDTRGKICRNGSFHLKLSLRDGKGIRIFWKKVVLLQ